MQQKGIILPLLILLQLVGSLVRKSSIAAAFTPSFTGGGSFLSRHEMTRIRNLADHTTETKNDNNNGDNDNSDHPPMVIVFGRPGAGKTTVADRAAALLHEQCQNSKARIIEDDDGDEGCATYGNDNVVLALDLDVCVPQWMKDNFAKGLYPTLAQRLEFAELACAHVETKHKEHHQQQRLIEQYENVDDAPTPTILIVSFSFVNTDLRHAFRQRFPRALWALVDTSEDEAQRRIEERRGHFYKGRRAPPPLQQGNDDATTEMAFTTSTSAIKSTGTSGTAIQDENNSDWEFAPVTFDHLILPGDESVERNAERVVDLVRTSLWK
ncbi:hypothetical protein MHU86_23864 [Fragilaria crotonensis]|nr:hypothetical protein MHU86_23864 [Fragilaria crotonensis]